MTNRQRKREERARDKEARRKARKRAEYEKLRHKQRQADPFRSPDFHTNMRRVEAEYNRRRELEKNQPPASPFMGP